MNYHYLKQRFVISTIASNLCEEWPTMFPLSYLSSGYSLRIRMHQAWSESLTLVRNTHTCRFKGLSPGGPIQVNYVVIREQKKVGKGTFLLIIAVRADRVQGIHFMKTWKKGYTFQSHNWDLMYEFQRHEAQYYNICHQSADFCDIFCLTSQLKIELF